MTSSSSKSYFAALKLAVDRASDDVFIADKAHFLLRWSATIPLLPGLRKEFARTQDCKVGVALAHAYWARLNFYRAYRVFNKVLLKDSHNLEALSGRVAIDIERGKSAEKIIHQLDNVLKVCPDDRMALRNIVMYLLDADDDRGVDFAERCMTLYPDEIDVPQFLSAYYFRRERYDQAATALDCLTADMQKRSVRMLASERLAFIRRYATSAEFRAETDRKVRTKQVVGWAWLALSLTPLVLYAGFLVWGWMDTHRRRERMSEMRTEMRETMLDLAPTNQTFLTNSQGELILREYKVKGWERETAHCFHDVGRADGNYQRDQRPRKHVSGIRPDLEDPDPERISS